MPGTRAATSNNAMAKLSQSTEATSAQFQVRGCPSRQTVAAMECRPGIIRSFRWDEVVRVILTSFLSLREMVIKSEIRIQGVEIKTGHPWSRKTRWMAWPSREETPERSCWRVRLPSKFDR